MNITKIKLEAAAVLAKLAPYLRIAKNASEHIPERGDGPLAVLIKCMAIADVIREQGSDTGYWRRLRDERSLTQQDSETFVALFFGTVLRDAYKTKRKAVTERVDLVEADLGDGQSIVFREERWGDQPRMANEFLLSPCANLDGVIDRLWAAYPRGIYVSMEAGQWGYNNTTSIAEVVDPPLHYLSRKAQRRLASTIDTQYRVANAGKHRTYICYGEPGTGKTVFAVGLARGCGGRVLQFDSTALPMIGVKELGFLIDTLKPSALILNDLDKAPMEKVEARMRYLFEALKKGHADVPLIVTVNDPSKIDSAILRPPRIQKPFEFTLPDREEREELIEELSNLFGLNLTAVTKLDLVEGSEGLSQAYVAHLMEASIHEDPMEALADMKQLHALAKGKADPSGSPPSTKAVA